MCLQNWPERRYLIRVKCVEIVQYIFLGSVERIYPSKGLIMVTLIFNSWYELTIRPTKNSSIFRVLFSSRVVSCDFHVLFHLIKH